MTVPVDEFLRHLGNPGKYQVIIFTLLCLNYIPLALNHLIFAFVNRTPLFRCKVFDQYENETFGSSCYNDNVTGDAATCADGYEYNVGPGESTVVTEWNLVCDVGYLAPMITSAYYAGVMFGGIAFGVLSDRYGRRKMLVVCTLCQGVFAVTIAFNKNLAFLVCLKILQGFFVQGLQCTTYTLAMELFLPDYRAVAGAVIEIFWASGIIILGIAAYFFPAWRQLQLFVGVVSISVVSVLWYIPESLRWLISTGRDSEACKLADRMKRFNRICESYDSTDQEIKRIQIGKGEERITYNIKDLFRTPVVRRSTLILSFSWLAISVSYYGVTLNIPNLSGNRHLNFIFSGMIEIKAYCLTLMLLKKVGRKVALSSCLVLSGMLFTVTLFVIFSNYDDMEESWETIVTVLALLGKATIVSAFCVIFIYTSELYPTVIRALGMGFCIFWTRLGSLLAPQIIMLDFYISKLVSYMIFALITLAAGCLTCTLPETKGRGLPDTIFDVELLSTTKSKIHEMFMQEIDLSDNEDDCSESSVSSNVYQSNPVPTWLPKSCMKSRSSLETVPETIQPGVEGHVTSKQ